MGGERAEEGEIVESGESRKADQSSSVSTFGGGREDDEEDDWDWERAAAAEAGAVLAHEAISACSSVEDSM
jgi:hypothetical protein